MRAINTVSHEGETRTMRSFPQSAHQSDWRRSRFFVSSTCLSDSRVSVASSQALLPRQVGGGAIDLQAQLHVYAISTAFVYTRTPEGSVILRLHGSPVGFRRVEEAAGTHETVDRRVRKGSLRKGSTAVG